MEVVTRDLELVLREGAELGLQLNELKFEVVGTDPTAREKVLTSIPGAREINSSSAVLLGSPIGDVNSISDAISQKLHLLQTMADRLQHIPSHDALVLLRNSFAIPKLLHLLRSSPSFLSSRLKDCDLTLRSAISTITNSHLDDDAWTQASLPVKAGGLGIRSAVHLAPSAFLSSTSACNKLVHHILPPRFNSKGVPQAEAALTLWSQGHDSPPPPSPASHHQKAWDSCTVEAIADSLLDNAQNALSRARLLAASTKESGAWLNALPITSLGLRMDDDTIRVAVGLCLGTSLCRPHTCHHCGTEVDHLGTPVLSCKHSEGRHHHHAALNDTIHWALTSAHIPSRLEPTGICRSDGKRPDSITVVLRYKGQRSVFESMPQSYIRVMYTSRYP